MLAAVRSIDLSARLDCLLEAIKRVWEAGNSNFHVMLPFVRTPQL